MGIQFPKVPVVHSDDKTVADATMRPNRQHYSLDASFPMSHPTYTRETGDR
jgi:hypothetical protein